jgi:hypothetical protein
MASFKHTFTSGQTVTPARLNDARDVFDIVNADIKSDAAIVGTKIAPNFGSQNVTTSGLIEVTSDGDSALTLSRASSNTTAAQISFFKSRNTQASKQVVVSGDISGLIRFYGYDGTSLSEAARIQANIDGTPGANDMPGRLVFSTTADGASSITERMRIDSDGNVGIANAAPTEKLDVTGNIKVSGSATFDGQVRVPFGESATPGLAFDGDSDTGIIRPGSNELSFVTGGSQAMRINASNNVGIGVSSIDSSCLLQMASTTKGFRPPIMSTAQRNAVSSPATGLIVYNTTTDKINFYNGTSWQAVTSS